MVKICLTLDKKFKLQKSDVAYFWYVKNIKKKKNGYIFVNTKMCAKNCLYRFLFFAKNLKIK